MLRRYSVGSLFLGLVFVLAGTAASFLFFPGGGVSQISVQTCTDKSTPRQCYEAGLAAVADSLGRMKALEASIDSRLTLLQAHLELPPGAIVAFENTCPASGWIKLPGADGRYLRVAQDKMTSTG